MIEKKKSLNFEAMADWSEYTLKFKLTILNLKIQCN